MNAARASLLALLLCWACSALALVAVPPLSGRVVDQTGTLACRRHRLADADAEGSGDAKGQPDRGADRADDRRRGDRAVLAAGRGSLEDRPQEDRRRRAARHRQERSPPADRGRLRPRRRAHRRHHQAHHRRRHHAEIQEPAISPAAFLPGVDRMVRVVDGEKLPEPEPPHWQSPGLFNYIDPVQSVSHHRAVIIGGILRGTLGRLLGSAATGG